MDINVSPGNYVVAVSGGIDSVVLLHALLQQQQCPRVDLKLVVAHFDHGIRRESAADRRFVERLASQYKLPFYYDNGHLGPNASEELAREKRYEFLRRIMRQTDAHAILTAHHQDDLIETAIINLIRGTGRRGLTSLGSGSGILRPLLHVSKKDIRAYAQSHGLEWIEDVTNQDERYLRNYVRRQIVAKMLPSQRAEMLRIIRTLKQQNLSIERLVKNQLDDHLADGVIDRNWFISLPHAVAREVLIRWCRESGINYVSRRHIELLTVLLKTLPRGKLVDVDAGTQLKIEAHKLALVGRER